MLCSPVGRAIMVFKEESDRIRNFFIRPFFQSLTIGVPFCTFKLLFGLSAVRNGEWIHPVLLMAGYIIIFWACMDLMMNTSRAILDLLSREAPFEYCTIAQAGRFFRMPMVFLALDTLISFLIICTMLWSGWIATLSPAELIAWSAATTMNLISLSIVGLYHEIQRL